MSRTDKDVPYWVRLNNEGTVTDHDHLHLGDPIYKHVYLTDENDQPLMETLPKYVAAVSIVNRADMFMLPYWYGGEERWKYYTSLYGDLPEPVIRRAITLVNEGRGAEGVQVGEYTRQRSERRLVGYVADHCTAGEKMPHRRDWLSNRAMPCTPDFGRDERHWWEYGTTSDRDREHEAYYTAQRTKLRGHNRRMVKEWNAGYDLEDWDEPDDLTNNQRSYIFW